MEEGRRRDTQGCLDSKDRVHRCALAHTCQHLCCAGVLKKVPSWKTPRFPLPGCRSGIGDDLPLVRHSRLCRQACLQVCGQMAGRSSAFHHPTDPGTKAKSSAPADSGAEHSSACEYYAWFSSPCRTPRALQLTQCTVRFSPNLKRPLSHLILEPLQSEELEFFGSNLNSFAAA